MGVKKIIFITNPWASSQIRGYQVAARLNAVVNPQKITDIDDTFVFVKSLPVENVFNDMYIDIVDAYAILDELYKFPKAKIIAISEMAKTYIQNRCDNEVFVIPEHHCNFENTVRTRTNIATVGFIGYKDNFLLNVKEVSDALSDIGLGFLCKFECDFKTREDICEFYMSIDIQLTFRPKFPKHPCPPELKNSLKLSNAGSFKIPTVACNEPSYVADYAGRFSMAFDINSAVEACEKLKSDEAWYNIIQYLCSERAKDFHIDKIIPKYKELLNV